MYKMLGGVLLLSAVSFAALIEIDLPVDANGWDHANATLIGVDLGSYIGDGQVVTSAVLSFTGVQNYMEPETNDRLWIDLLKCNRTFSGQQDVFNYTDNQGGTDVLGTNYFKTVSSGDYNFVSELQYYTDENDIGATEEFERKVAYWEQTQQYLDAKAAGLASSNPYYWRYEFGSQWQSNGTYSNVNYIPSSIVRNGQTINLYDGSNANGTLWSKYSNWTTENFVRGLDATVVNNLMASSNGVIGIGLDADCHYSGNVKLLVNTQSVPEPSLLTLLGCGLLGLVFVRRRK